MTQTRSSTAAAQIKLNELLKKAGELQTIIETENALVAKTLQEQAEQIQEEWFSAAREGDADRLRKLYIIVKSIAPLTREYDHINYESYPDDKYFLIHYAKAYAFEKGFIPVLDFLIEIMKDIGIDPNKWLHTGIYTFEKDANPESLTLVPPVECGIYHKYSFRFNGGKCMYPMIFAIQKKDHALTEYLINHSSTNHGDYKIVNQNNCFLSCRREYDKKGTVLTCAIENGMTQAAKLLIDKGAEFNDVSHIDTRLKSTNFTESSLSGCSILSPLQLAALLNNIEIVSLLLNKGANAWNRERHRQNAYELTTSPEIKRLILSYSSYEERLKIANYTGLIPEHLCYPLGSNILMESPAIYQNQAFCQLQLLDKNSWDLSDGYKDPFGKRISKKSLLDLLRLPLDKKLQNEIEQFVNEKEKMNEHTHALPKHSAN